MKHLSLEEIVEYRKKYKELCKCDATSWVTDSDYFIKLKIGLLIFSKFIREIGISDIEISKLPKHTQTEINEEIVGDYYLEYGEELDTLVTSVYTRCGWTIESFNVYSLLVLFFTEELGSEYDPDEYIDGSLIENHDFVKLWETKLKTFADECLCLMDFTFFQNEIEESLSITLSSSIEMLEFTMYSNPKLGRYLSNASHKKVKNVKLAKEIRTLLEYVKFPNSIEPQSCCKRGINEQGVYMFNQATFVDKDSCEEITPHTNSLYNTFCSVLLDRALVLMEEEQPELFYKEIVEHKEVVTYAAVNG